jgi:predicted cupin superfamily sugar epimerase
MDSDATALIDRLGLTAHPEGGWYRELHRSSGRVQRHADRAHRAGLTVIVFLLTAGQRSRWHRVNGADETWHHAGGDPLALWSLSPEPGAEAEQRRLGPYSAAVPDQSPLHIIPAGWWQAATPLGRWSLLHCTVGPGFDFADFALLADQPEAERPQGARADLL